MHGMSGYGERELSDAPQALPRQRGPKVALQEHIIIFIIIIMNTMLSEQDSQNNSPLDSNVVNQPKPYYMLNW